MRPSILSIGQLFSLAFTKEVREKLEAAQKRKYERVPAGTELVSFTTDGKNRLKLSVAEAQSARNPKANPVPVFRRVYA